MRLSRSERVESSGVIILILFCWLSDIITKHYPARWRMQISDLYIYKVAHRVQVQREMGVRREEESHFIIERLQSSLTRKVKLITPIHHVARRIPFIASWYNVL